MIVPLSDITKIHLSFSDNSFLKLTGIKVWYRTYYLVIVLKNKRIRKKIKFDEKDLLKKDILLFNYEINKQKRF